MYFKYYIFHTFKSQLLFKTWKISFITEHITYDEVQLSGFRGDAYNLSFWRTLQGPFISFV